MSGIDPFSKIGQQALASRRSLKSPAVTLKTASAAMANDNFRRREKAAALQREIDRSKRTSKIKAIGERLAAMDTSGDGSEPLVAASSEDVDFGPVAASSSGKSNVAPRIAASSSAAPFMPILPSALAGVSSSAPLVDPFAQARVAASSSRGRRGVGPGVAVSSSSAIVDDDEEEDDEDFTAAAAAAPLIAAPGFGSRGAAGDGPVAASSSVAVGPAAVGPGDADAFWAAILGDDFPAGDKREAIEVLTKLAFFDSIHDFWPERKTKKQVTDEDDDSPLEIDEKRLETVHTRLVDSIRKYLGTPGLEIYKILGNATNQMVSAPAGLEDRVLAYFKKKYKPFNEPERTMTVDEILSAWKFTDYASDWGTYSAAVKALPNALDITIGNKSIKSRTDAERGTIGFFLLAFMNPDIDPGKGSFNFTFDMAPKDVGKIFARFKQVYNAIYPQNIADSASTSFSALLGRNKFFRADYTVATPGGATLTKRVRSNAFTQQRYILEFVDKGFSEKNKFGFEIKVRNATTGADIGTIPFGPGSEQGPSVNYLMDLLSAPGANVIRVVMPEKGRPIAKLNELGIFDPDLLFDIKRLGDQEQMLADSAIGITGDRFAGAFRRLLRKAGIFHSVKGLRVWRGMGALSVEEMANQSRDFRKAQIIGKLSLIAALMAAEDGDDLTEVDDDVPGAIGDVLNQLRRMKSKVRKGSESGTVFMNTLQIKGLLTKDYIDANYTQIASTFATYLLRARMNDIASQINSLKKRVKQLIRDLPGIDAAACAIEQPKPSNPAIACPAPSAPPNIDEALDILDGFIEKINALESSKITFKKWEARGREQDPIYVDLFTKKEGGRRLNKGATSSFFNFSAGPFLHPESGISAIVARLLVLSKARRPEAVAPQINKLLVQYFQARDAIKEAFFDEGTKTMIEELTDITSGLSPAEVVTLGPDKLGLIGAIQRVAEKYETAVRPAPAAAAPAAANAMMRGGADGSPLQFRDLHDLFIEICMDASLAVETRANAGEALDQIQSKWVMEVDELRTHSLDDYDVEFEESATTDLISYLLSFRTDRNPLFDIPAAVNERRELPIFSFITAEITKKADVNTFILQVLRSIGSNVIGVANANIANTDLTYASRANWNDRLSVGLQTIVQTLSPSPQVLGLLRGGDLEGGDDSSSNASDTGTGSSRRGLYAGLRKRSGEGPSPGV